MAYDSFDLFDFSCFLSFVAARIGSEFAASLDGYSASLQRRLARMAAQVEHRNAEGISFSAAEASFQQIQCHNNNQSNIKFPKIQFHNFDFNNKKFQFSKTC